jgi:hypothetical protein
MAQQPFPPPPPKTNRGALLVVGGLGLVVAADITG